MLFEQDIFSNNIPVWNKIDQNDGKSLKHLLKYIPKLYISEILTLEL